MKKKNKKYLLEEEYFKAIAKKCKSCKEGRYLENTSQKSDWKGWRVCSRCEHKVICIWEKGKNNGT